MLTLTTTHNPATDLGYLVHKNPAKLHSFELSFGKAHVFYRHQCGALGTSHPQFKHEFRLTLTSNREAGGAVVEPPA